MRVLHFSILCSFGRAQGRIKKLAFLAAIFSIDSEARNEYEKKQMNVSSYRNDLTFFNISLRLSVQFEIDLIYFEHTLNG